MDKRVFPVSAGRTPLDAAAELPAASGLPFELPKFELPEFPDIELPEPIAKLLNK